MTILTGIIIILLCVASAILWQHLRYLAIRRDIVDDRQPLLYSAQNFHAVTYLKVEEGKDAFDGMRAVRAAIESSGGEVVYAGLVGMAIVRSKQIPNDWTAVVLAQYPSRETFNKVIGNSDYKMALQGFENSYTHGVKRPVRRNIVLPLMLLIVRIRNFLKRVPPILPFTPAGDEVSLDLRQTMQDAKSLDHYRDIKDDAVVVFNLILSGDEAQRSADKGYAQQMMSLMAEGSYGPMHVGGAVTLEGNANFMAFLAVYYPGIDHIQAMFGSSFFNRISSGKQLGDSLAVATIPVLSKL